MFTMEKPGAAALPSRTAGAILGMTLAVAAAPGAMAGVPPVAAGADGGVAPLVLRDALQREVRFERVPLRIISLLPSLTETVCALGACDRLVATDRYSNWPARVRSLPKAGGLDDAQIELIVSLRPDVVLLSHEARVTERLDELQVRSFVIETESYADIARTTRIVGAILGVPERAAALNRELDRAVTAVAARSAASLRGRPPLVYYEVDGAPFGAGPRSFIGALLTRLGGRNIVSEDLGPFPALNPEYVVLHDPDVIFVAPADAATLTHRPGWEQIRAVRERRICSFPSEVRDTIVRPGPRVADGMRAIADCLDRVAP